MGTIREEEDKNLYEDRISRFLFPHTHQCYIYLLGLSSKSEYDTRSFLRVDRHTHTSAYGQSTKDCQFPKQLSCWHRYYIDTHLFWFNEGGAVTELKSSEWDAFSHRKWGENTWFHILSKAIPCSVRPHNYPCIDITSSHTSLDSMREVLPHGWNPRNLVPSPSELL